MPLSVAKMNVLKIVADQFQHVVGQAGKNTITVKEHIQDLCFSTQLIELFQENPGRNDVCSAAKDTIDKPVFILHFPCLSISMKLAFSILSMPIFHHPAEPSCTLHACFNNIRAVNFTAQTSAQFSTQ
jgi:hypothetical protein